MFLDYKFPFSLCVIYLLPVQMIRINALNIKRFTLEIDRYHRTTSDL